MSLTPIESVQLNTYFDTGNFAGGSYHILRVPLAAPPGVGILYVDRVDAFICAAQQQGPTLSGVAQFDPLRLSGFKVHRSQQRHFRCPGTGGQPKRQCERQDG